MFRPTTVQAFYTFRADSPQARRSWLTALGGVDAVLVHDAGAAGASGRVRLDDAGFLFVQRCLDALERRGLTEEGLYRMVGTSSKVEELLRLGLDPGRAEEVLEEMLDEKEREEEEEEERDGGREWETKTITSAVKSYFRLRGDKLEKLCSYFGTQCVSTTTDILIEDLFSPKEPFQTPPHLRAVPGIHRCSQ